MKNFYETLKKKKKKNFSPGVSADQIKVSPYVGNGCMSYLNAGKFVHDLENGFANNTNTQEAYVMEQESFSQQLA